MLCEWIFSLLTSSPTCDPGLLFDEESSGWLCHCSAGRTLYLVWPSLSRSQNVFLQHSKVQCLIILALSFMPLSADVWVQLGFCHLWYRGDVPCWQGTPRLFLEVPKVLVATEHVYLLCKKYRLWVLCRKRWRRPASDQCLQVLSILLSHSFMPFSLRHKRVLFLK